MQTLVFGFTAGAYGLPQLRGSGDFKLYDDFDEEFVFEYPRSWVGRRNSLRQGVYVSDFNVRLLSHSHGSAFLCKSQKQLVHFMLLLLLRGGCTHAGNSQVILTAL